MNLQSLLAARVEAGKPIRVGLIGAGKFGSMFLAQVPSIAGLEVALICDRDVDRAKAACHPPNSEDISQRGDIVNIPTPLKDRLIELANRYLSRLFKVEHYYNRMRDMEITIAQMGTVMHSMADPVILTDTEQRLVMLN